MKYNYQEEKRCGIVFKLFTTPFILRLSHFSCSLLKKHSKQEFRFQMSL